MGFMKIGAVFASVLLVACTSSPNKPSTADIPLEGEIVALPSGGSRLIVTRDGASYAGDLVAVRDHVHKGKGSHFRAIYRAEVSAADKISMICSIKRLESGSSGSCVNQAGETKQLRMK